MGSGVYYLTSQNKPGNQINSSISVAKALSDDDTSGYQRATRLKQFVFPADHGPHPGFRTEWWYYTGNLTADNGAHYGYQLTIFRNALSADSVSSDSKWRTNQIYMAHFTLTDVENNKFYSFERLSRGAEGLAGASASPFKVWLEDWKIQEVTGGSDFKGIPVIKLIASQDNISIELTLKSLKPVVLQGEKGLSRKGSEYGNASYYYSLTRMETKGKVVTGKETLLVKGFSWMDREWSTSALSKDQTGWDWFSLQLNDGREIMYYQMRKKDGSTDQFSNGTFIYKDGTTKPLKQKDIELKVLGKWQSPQGGVYPSHWSLMIPAESINLEITPYIKNQELNVSIHYWEGAVKITGNSTNEKVIGEGYVELTGYDKAL